MTVNAELQGKIEELTIVNDDVRNLLDNTNIATIFLDKQLRIKRFTPAATQIVNLIPSDVGRPLNHLVFKLELPVHEEAKKVLETLIPNEMEVRNNEGRSYLSRIMPYRTVDDLVDGVGVRGICHRCPCTRSFRGLRPARQARLQLCCITGDPTGHR